MKNLEKKECIYCTSHELYRVSKTQYRCPLCKRTWSHKKQHQEAAILEAFLNNLSAKKAATELQLNYATVQKRYEKYRMILSLESQKLYHTSTACEEYDEYYYLPSSKKKNAEHLFDAIGILGMLYQDKVHTLLLPDHFENLKSENVAIQEKEAYAKFLSHHKIAHLESFDSRLNHFWGFLETSLHRFKGVTKTNFIYYLKEVEFKFNYSKEDLSQLLSTFS